MEFTLSYPAVSPASSITQWKKLLRRCLCERVGVCKFNDFRRVMVNEYPIQPQHLIDIVLDSRSVTNVEWDPLIPEYVDCLLKTQMMRISDLLWSLLQHSTISQKQQQSDNLKRPSTLMTDYKIIQNVMLSASAGLVPDTDASAVNTFTAISSWILDLLAWNNNNSSDNETGKQPESLINSSDGLAIFEAFGILFATLSSTQQGVSALSAVKDGKCALSPDATNDTGILTRIRLIYRVQAEEEDQPGAVFLLAVLYGNVFPASE